MLSLLLQLSEMEDNCKQDNSEKYDFRDTQQEIF